MTMLTKWDPLNELEGLSNRLNHFFAQPDQAASKSDTDWYATAEWAPRVDIAESDHNYTIEAELPRVDKDKIQVQLDDGVLTISGEREFKNEDKSKTYHRVERSYGRFVRSFNLPDDVDNDQVKAEFKEGILTVVVQKAESKKPRQIDIQVK
ncbi:MAG: Hsp20/alpha crystallin family protein [Verrucomicrobiota bacterium]